MESESREQQAGRMFATLRSHRHFLNHAVYAMTISTELLAGANWFVEPSRRWEYSGLPAITGVAMLGIVAVGNVVLNRVEDEIVEMGMSDFANSPELEDE